MNEWAWTKLEAAGKWGRCLELGFGRDLVLLASPLAPGECYLPTAQRLAVRAACHEDDVVAGGGKTPAEVAADPAGAQDRNPHRRSS